LALLPVKDQANVAAGDWWSDVLGAAVALSRVNRTHPAAVPFLARRSARAFVVESIMGQEPEKIPGSDGMSVMRKVLNLERAATAADVVIRNVTGPLWQACIDAVDPPPRDSRQADAPTIQRRVCAVGTPGIGKSTCTPVVIKMLLERKKTVVYRVRSEDNDEGIYEFIPGSGGGDPVAANVYPAQAFRSGIASLSEASTFYVVD
jgi:hypothetical protein